MAQFRFTYDEEFVETDIKTEGVIPLSTESAEVSTSRKRPRGSGVGKSIHKAAEAPVHSTPRSLVISKSQISHRGQTITPRISTSNVTINGLHDDAELSPPHSSRQHRQKNLARKTVKCPKSGVQNNNQKVRTGSGVVENEDGQPPPTTGMSLDRSSSGSSSSESGPLRRSTSLETAYSLDLFLDNSLRSYPDPISNNIVEIPPPPDPLVKAYENLLAYCFLFQRNRKLPFLLRNLKRSFRIRCRRAGEVWPSDHNTLSYGEKRKQTILVSYRYIDPQGVQYAFQSLHFILECPLCSLMGVFPNWSTLAIHMQSNHPEMQYEMAQSANDIRPKIIICLNESGRFDHDLKVESGSISSQTSPTRSPTHPSDVEIGMKRLSVENIGANSEQSIDLSITRTTAPCSDREPNKLFQAFTIPAYHGPAEPVIMAGPNKTISYRPTGPRLHDHLASLSLDEFGPLSWFVLDKEEETFELTDVLDEDKVMCALWGRWILFNRSTFISDYKRGVEKFLEQHWTMIHKAAGWAAWRAWLLTLVYHRFLTNTDMVHLLRQYNELTRKYTVQS